MEMTRLRRWAVERRRRSTRFHGVWCAFFVEKAKTTEKRGGEKRDRERLPAKPTVLKNAQLIFDATVNSRQANTVEPVSSGHLGNGQVTAYTRFRRIHAKHKIT